MMSWLTAIVVGAVVGTLYFGGLWLTVSRLITNKRAASLALMSWLLRMMLFVGVFYLLSTNGPTHVLLGFGSFWCARLYLLHHLGGRLV